MNEIKNSITIINSEVNGPKIAIFAGVHGNEKAGILVIDYLKNNLKLKKGTVQLVVANPPAVEGGVRQVNKNLNRNIFVHEDISVYEDMRANELVKILDNSDALLDLHSFNEPDNDPFIICDTDSNEIALKLGFKYIVNGMGDVSPGSTELYMHNNNKIGICAELGSSFSPEKYVELGINTVFKFLKHFDMVDFEDETNSDAIKSEIINTYLVYKRKSEEFTFTKDFKTFDYIEKDFVFAKDGDIELKIENRGSYILFPRPNNPIGVEVFALAEKI